MRIGKYVGIDPEWTVKRLREIADKLEEDFFGNLFVAAKDLGFFTDTLSAKINALMKEAFGEQLKEYCEKNKENEKVT